MKVLPFPGERKPVLLCVDDEQMSLQVRRLMLESAGFRVHTAATAGEAMKVVETVPIDLVLTDYYLDGSTGGQLAHAVKEASPRVIVAIYSGAEELPQDAEYADAVFVKTGGAKALIGEIRSLLERRQEAA